jgi:membrane protease YdiL (CAAX protease family)
VSGNSRPLTEALVLLVLTFALAMGLHAAVLWALVPVLWLTWCRRDPAKYGLTWDGWVSWRFHIFNTVGVFGAYLVGHYCFGRFWLGQEFSLRLPSDPLWFGVNQFFATAIPEECFFRGYLQSQLDLVWPPRWRLLGANVGPGLFVAALLFGLCHILHGGPGRLVTALPGIWYGWQRARSGSIAAPALYHATSNFLMATMLASLSS